MAELNRAGRPIWFRHVEGGAYRPVTRAGGVAMALAVGWLLGCALLSMIAFAVTLNPLCFVAMFVAVGLGLAGFAVTVARHS